MHGDAWSIVRLLAHQALQLRHIDASRSKSGELWRMLEWLIRTVPLMLLPRKLASKHAMPRPAKGAVTASHAPPESFHSLRCRSSDGRRLRPFCRMVHQAVRWLVEVPMGDMSKLAGLLVSVLLRIAARLWDGRSATPVMADDLCHGAKGRCSL